MAEENTATTILQSLVKLGPRQKIAAATIVSAIIALIVGMWIWSQDPDYRVLYGNLSDRDGGAIIDALKQQNIPYKFSEGGGVLMIPAKQIHEVRLRLASQGLPKGSLPGFELLENQKFGTSQFLEQVNYQRALEGELARSVQTLEAVKTARVHLALPKPTVFVKEKLHPSASVVLTLLSGRSLYPNQINGIIHLISSSVPDMPAKNVTILDQTGSMLSPNKDGNDTRLDPTQIKYVRQIEKDYSKRIEAILGPLVGSKNVHAQITADIDFSQSEQTAETFGPNQPPNEAAVRSRQVKESKNNGVKTPAGVPGALSNQPPVPATAPIVNPASAIATAAGGSGASSRKDNVINYEVDRTIRYTKLPVGSIQRLSVAVIINNRMVKDKDGKTISKSLTDNEKEEITALVKESMGFNAGRGDSLNILNSAFNEDVIAAEPALPWWKQPEMIDLGKELLRYAIIVAIALYLILGVIRPAIRNIEQAKEKEKEEARQAIEEEALENPPPEPPDAYSRSLESVQQMAINDTKVVASVIREWVNNDE